MSFCILLPSSNPIFPTIFSNQTNINQSLASDSGDPLQRLWKHSASSAMVKSPAVSCEPTCHPGTRQVVRGHITGWARDPKAVPILWLTGPAGAGKSCIQRTIVQSCVDENLLGGCFFFSTKQVETNNQRRFIPTLAAQLVGNIPGVKRYVERAIRKDGRIFTRGLESQAEGLIVQPLQELNSSISNRLTRLFWSTLKTLVAYQEDPNPQCARCNVIIIDGLDECLDEKDQTRILHLIHELATLSHFPFRFAISSRPKYAIRSAFSSPPLSKDTLILRLEDYEVDGDLRRFLKAEFSRLKSSHPIATSIPADWPSTEAENALVTRASGQFVYVSVVIKHLGNPRQNPILELQNILDYQLSENNTNPFAELDALYDRILHPPAIETSLLKSILHTIIHDKLGEAAVDDFDILLGFTRGTTSSTLTDLGSVLNFNSLTRRPTLHHICLQDYLTSHSRAGDLYQSSDQTHAQLTLAYYELVRQPQALVTLNRDDWDLSLLAMSHACSVSDWSLFAKGFTKSTLPAFIDSTVRNHVALSRDITPTERSRLDLYSRRYHSFYCTSEDACLPSCKRLTQLSLLNTYGLPSDAKTLGNNVHLAPPVMLDISGCRCTEFAVGKEMTTTATKTPHLLS